MTISTNRKILLIVSAALIAFIVSGAFLGRAVAIEGTYNSLRVFNEVLYLVNNNYVQPVALDSLMEGSYRGLLESLDPGNEYLRPAQYEAASRGATAGPAGAGLQVFKRRGYVVIVSVARDSPAAEEGLKTGDVIISIDGESTRHMGVWQGTQSLLGAAGSEVILLVSPAGGRERRTITLQRTVPPKAVPAGTLASQGVGVVRLSDIREGDARRLDKTLARLEDRGMRRLLLDLRGCAADSLSEAIGLASLFIPEGSVVEVSDRREGDRVYAADGRQRGWAGPLAILMDEGTARSCEVLAAALHDRLDAPLLGERTWGIGSLRALIPLRSGAGVYLAVGSFRSPSGHEWNGKGIEPDVLIPGQPFDESDPQRQKAIEHLRDMVIPAADQDAA